MPYIIVMNLMIFGGCIFDSWVIFLLSFLYSALFLLIMYFTFGRVALLIRSFYAAPADLMRRTGIMLPVFYVLNVLFLALLFGLYRWLPLVNCPVQSNVWWAVLFGCLTSTGITFMNEGISNWELWKASIAETDKLRSTYQRSKLLGLKGQMNPHFLFNCFNTLSGLIQEDEERAEKFLDEMTKVHRYLLCYDDDMLVPLQNEIRFAKSYLHLVKERFGDAVVANINISDEAMHYYLPPLSMHVVLEEAIYSNIISKTEPLHISIFIKHRTKLCITNSVQPKTIIQCFQKGEGFNNLLEKYSLLNSSLVSVAEKENEKTVVLPLFITKEISV